MKIAGPNHHQLQQIEHCRHYFGVVEGDVAVQLLAEEVLEEEQHEEHEEAPQCPHERRLVRALEQRSTSYSLQGVSSRRETWLC